MGNRRSRLSVALLTSLLAMPALAQDVGEAAKKEKKRDKRSTPSQPPAKVYTDEDLEKYRPAPPPEDKPAPGSQASGPRTGRASAASTPPVPPTRSGGATGQPPAKRPHRVGEERRGQEGNEAVAPVETGEPPVTEGLPAPTVEPAAEGDGEASGSDEQQWRTRAEELRSALSLAQSSVEDLQQRLDGLRNDTGMDRVSDPFRLQNIQAEIGQVTADLAGAKMQLEAARRAIEDFEEEARRANVPPGWLRERPNGPES